MYPLSLGNERAGIPKILYSSNVDKYISVVV